MIHSEKRPRLAIGVDLGGTKIEAVVAEVLEARIDVRTRRRVATPQEDGYEAVLGATAALVVDTALEGSVDAAKVPIGVAMPGGVTRSGLVRNSNTTCLNGRAFRSDLTLALGRSVVFDNDANCFALAETELGAGAPYRSGIVFGVILGTGVGGGWVVGGEVWQGAQGIAGEWGHHAVFADRDVPCYCGKKGCLERFASGPAVEADYARRSGVTRSLGEIANLRATDAHAAAAIERFLKAFGRGLANVINIVDPTAIVLGGGVSNLPLLYDEGVARVADCVFLASGAVEREPLATPILKNALGDSAGVLGAALLAASPSQS